MALPDSRECSPRTRVPSETVDMIIDHLHDCKCALQSCALVSHAWLLSSRFHLFRRIELYTQGYETADPHPCSKLYAAIQRSPSIAAIIQELYIREGQDEKEQDWINATPSLISLLDSLTHLNTLYLRRVDWIDLTSNLRGAFRRVFVSNPVSHVDFEICTFPISSFLSILGTCSKPTSLTLRSVMIDDTSDIWPKRTKIVEDEEAGNVDLGNKCQFHDLRMVRSSLKILSWFNDPENGPDLSHLHTLHCDADGHSRTLLLKVGGGLQHLRITAPNTFPNSSQPAVVLPLEYSTGLRCLQVTRISILDPTYYSSAGPGWVKQQLQSAIALPHLQEIVLELGDIKENPMNLRDAWGAVDDIFNGDTFPELTRVGIQAYPLKSTGFKPPWHDLRDQMVNIFPRLKERKILDFYWK